MALIDCQKCGATIGSRLSSCPYCDPDDANRAVKGASFVDAPKADPSPHRISGNAALAVACLFVSLAALAFSLLRNTPSPVLVLNDAGTPSTGEPPGRTTSPAETKPAGTVATSEKELGASQIVQPEDAVDQLALDAEQGDPRAQFELGLSTYPDADRVRDYRESLRWFTEAAERGHVESQMQVGWMHYEGQGVVRDSDEALKWYRMAAEQGNVEAKRAVVLLTSEQSELARLEAVQLELAKFESAKANAGAANASGGPSIAPNAAIESGESSSVSFRENPNVGGAPHIVFNESNQYITIHQQPDPPGRDLDSDANNRRFDPRDRSVNYLAASGFFSRARQDAASRAFFERHRQDDRHRTSASRQSLGKTTTQPRFSSQRVVMPRTLGGAPLTSSPRPLTKAVTPLGSYPKAPWED